MANSRSILDSPNIEDIKKQAKGLPIVFVSYPMHETDNWDPNAPYIKYCMAVLKFIKEIQPNLSVYFTWINRTDSGPWDRNILDLLTICDGMFLILPRDAPVLDQPSDLAIDVSAPSFINDYKKWIVRPFVLSEASAFIGIKHAFGAPCHLAGVIEPRVDYGKLALFDRQNPQLYSLDRSDLPFEHKDPKIKELRDYLRCFAANIRQYTQGLFALNNVHSDQLIYRQSLLHKTVTISRNGTIMQHNRNIIEISNPTAFKGNGIRHMVNVEPCLLKTPFPDLRIMERGTDVGNSCGEAFSVNLISVKRGDNVISNGNSHTLRTKRGDKDRFGFAFQLYIKGEIRSGDKIEYAYTFQRRGVFARFKEDLNKNEKRTKRKNRRDYDFVNVVPSHGVINDLEIELRFEKEKIGSKMKYPFEEPPKVYLSPPFHFKNEYMLIQDYDGQRNLDTSDPSFDIFRWRARNSHSIVTIRWVPISKGKCISLDAAGQKSHDTKRKAAAKITQVKASGHK